MDYSTPGFPLLHRLQELAQTPVHRVGNAIQPSHPLLSPFLPSIFPSFTVFLMSWLFASGGWGIGASASASVLPMNIQDWFPLGGLVRSPCCPRDSQFICGIQAPQFKSINSLALSFFIIQLSHPYMTTEINITLTIWTFVSKVMSLLFNTLCRCVIAFLPGSKPLLISWLPSPPAVILEPKKRKSVCIHFLPFYLPWSDGARCHDLNF